jgi:hypothetical protein
MEMASSTVENVEKISCTHRDIASNAEESFFFVKGEESAKNEADSSPIFLVSICPEIKLYINIRFNYGFKTLIH